MRFLAGIADVVRWPFERVAWSVERGLLWPLRERLSGWSPTGRSAGAAALIAIAVAAVLVGVLPNTGGGEASPERVAVATPAAVPTAAPQPRAAQPQGPALHGVAPSFGIGKGVGVAKATADDPTAAEPETTDNAPETTPGEEGAGATTSSAKPAPAGPAAMKIARRFSEAFVFYEVGQRPARAKAVFGETATPELAKALGERPPRLPANAKVPKARVVNLVPGPRDGKAYTVSVSLLRVGLTSELRLSLQADASGDWKVVDVLG